MKRVLCFGDSNTWGYNAQTWDRFPADVRWTGVMHASLGPGYEVIEEGLNGRTTVWNDPIEGYKNGYDYLIPCIETHKPLDLVIVMLGTNDLKQRFSVPAEDIAKGAAVLVRAVQRSETGIGGAAPAVLLAAPAPVEEIGRFAEMFQGAAAKSRKLSAHFKAIAQELGCPLLDAGEIVVSSPVDGIHLEPEEHAKLGRALAARVKEIIG